MKIKFITLLLLTVAWTISCKKEKTIQEQRTDIFIAGMQWDSLSGKRHAMGFPIRKRRFRLLEK